MGCRRGPRPATGAPCVPMPASANCGLGVDAWGHTRLLERSSNLCSNGRARVALAAMNPADPSTRPFTDRMHGPERPPSPTGWGRT